MQSFRSAPIVLVTEQDSAKLDVEGPAGLASWLAGHSYRVVRHHHAAGTQLFAEDDDLEYLCVLSRGWALKYKSLFEGRRQVLDFALPGDVLGFVGERRARHAVEMLTDGEVVSVPRELFGSLAAANPELMLKVVRQLERASTRAHEHMVSIGCRAALSRVSRLLVELVERRTLSSNARHDIEIDAPIRQIHVADALGLRGETVCRALKQLEAANLATFRRGRLRVPDLVKLRGVAETPDAEAHTTRKAIRRGAAPAATAAA